MPKAQRRQPALLPHAHAPQERLKDAGASAPGDVEAWHGVAVAGREIAAALGPLHEGEEANALGAEPAVFLAGCEVDVGFGPAAWPIVFGPIEGGAAEPILEGQ